MGVLLGPVSPSPWSQIVAQDADSEEEDDMGVAAEEKEEEARPVESLGSLDHTAVETLSPNTVTITTASH